MNHQGPGIESDTLRARLLRVTLCLTLSTGSGFGQARLGCRERTQALKENGTYRPPPGSRRRNLPEAVFPTNPLPASGTPVLGCDEHPLPQFWERLLGREKEMVRDLSRNPLPPPTPSQLPSMTPRPLRPPRPTPEPCQKRLPRHLTSFTKPEFKNNYINNKYVKLHLKQ